MLSPSLSIAAANLPSRSWMPKVVFILWYSAYLAVVSGSEGDDHVSFLQARAHYVSLGWDGDYLLSDDQFCPDGYSSDLWVDECRAAANKLSIYYVRAAKQTDNIAGCYAAPSGDGVMRAYFNTITDQQNAAPDNQRICRLIPTTDVSGGFGDPHMVNVMGEHFNIWRLGEVELLRIPRNSTYRTKLRLVATVSDEHGNQFGSSCTSAPYMTAMRLSGSLFGNQELVIRMVAGEMRVHVGSKGLSPLEKVPIQNSCVVSRPSEEKVTVQAGNATINVMHDVFFKPYFYLNTEARNLGSLGFEVGGVLGLDDHTVVAQKPAGCEEQFLAVRDKSPVSRASASFHD